MKKLKNLKSLFLNSVLGIILLTWVASFSACDFMNNEPDVNWDTLSVTASAYNSLDYQGEGDANITAWGDTLKPDQKVIAVSRDLIRRGLDYNTRVKIKGFKGEFRVKDKMNARWKNKIDIYMGKDSQKAREFGRKKLEIYYVVEEEAASE
jgi:3D (Asp-Asp-Asp) domain-containing protein